jgi:uncharacterized protein with PhoU and TrkA domain
MITGWLVRMVVIFAAVAVLLFDAGSIAVNFFTLDSKADEIAVSLGTSITNREINPSNAREVTTSAQEIAEAAGAKLVKAELSKDGTVHVRIRRTADTIVIGRFKQLRDWVRATADARAGSS